MDCSFRVVLFMLTLVLLLTKVVRRRRGRIKGTEGTPDGERRKSGWRKPDQPTDRGDATGGQ